MKLALTMPQFGESITEALIVRWLKKEGDEVKEQEPLIEMETEKSVFAYESPFKGTLTKILEAENQKVAVGKEIAHFEITDSLGEKYLSMGIGKSLEGLASPPQPAKPDWVPPSTPAEGGLEGAKKSVISPMIRSLAKENNIPLEEIEKLTGTGPGGRLTKDDLIKYLETRGKSKATASDVKVIPLSPIRARIAEKMSLSKKEIPHAGTGLDVDVTAIDEWRKKNDGKFSHLPFVLFAVMPALKKFPILNSSLKGQGIEEHLSIHLGIATATPQGLMVPVLHHAQNLGFAKINEEAVRLTSKARGGKLDVSELTGGTFTVNNTGALGAIRSNQIIPPSQSGILAVNRVTRRPWVVNEKIEIRSILSLDLSFDHRIVDGDAACGFLGEVKNQLENFNFSLI